MVSTFTWGLFLRVVMCRFLSRQAGWRPVDLPTAQGFILCFIHMLSLPLSVITRFVVFLISFCQCRERGEEAPFSIDDALHYTVVLSLLVT
jgi:hypothetical protein